MATSAGNFLKEAREAAGLRNKDVTTKIGVGSGWLSEVEYGFKHPNGHLETLCELYGVDPKDVPQFYIKRRGRAPKASNGSTMFDTKLDAYAKIAKIAKELGDEELIDLALVRMIDAVG